MKNALKCLQLKYLALNNLGRNVLLCVPVHVIYTHFVSHLKLCREFMEKEDDIWS